MEKNNKNHSFSRNGVSLHLRSKDVSEVMGNIPRWIGSWGTILLISLFIISMLLIFNINCIQRISGKAVIKTKEGTFQPQFENDLIVKKSYFLQIFISPDDFTKIQKEEEMTLYLSGEKKSSSGVNGIKLPIGRTSFNGGMLQVPLDRHTLERLIQSNSGYVFKRMDCQLTAETTVFRKVFSWLY